MLAVPDVVIFVVIFSGMMFSLWLAPRIINLRGPRLKVAVRLAVLYLLGYAVLVLALSLAFSSRSVLSKHVVSFILMTVPLGRMMKKTYGKSWKTLFVLCQIPMILGAIIISLVLAYLKVPLL